MLRNYLAAALRNLVRNRLYAAISIVGLAVGMAAAILAGLYVRDELTFDHFIPGHENVYVLISHTTLPGRPPQIADGVLPQIPGWMKLDYPQLVDAGRGVPLGGAGRPSVRRGEIEAVEDVSWVDPNFFQIVPIPTIAGDLSRPLAPESAVLTRSMARKYFGKDAPIGELIEINRGKPFKVAAVIEDLPANSHLNTPILAYTADPKAGFNPADARPYRRGEVYFNGRTYLKFADKAGAEAVARDLPAFVQRHIAPTEGPALQNWNNGVSYALEMVPLDRLHFVPQTLTRLAALNRQGSPGTLYALGVIAALILVIAGVNFVNLMTARAGRRAVEVGVRKAAGAERRHLVGQFLGESLIYAALGAVLAVALVALVLPAMNAALQRTIIFDLWRDPRLILGVVGLTLAMGVLAGAYPAFVLSSFRPAAVLKGGLPQTSGSAAVRQGLVILQFAILIGLILATAVVYRQTRYAMDRGIRLDTDQVLLLDMPCNEAFNTRLKALPGVRGAACSSLIDTALATESAAVIKQRDGRETSMGFSFVGYDFLELYGMRPLAGRFFSRDHPADVTPTPSPEAARIQVRNVVLNETAVRQLGYASPREALGKTLTLPFGEGDPPQVIGVTSDFSIDLLHGPVKPTAYVFFTPALNTVSVKLSGQAIPETLSAIDGLWREVGPPRALSRRFLGQYLQTLYIGTMREGWLVGSLSVVAVFIACLGLFGLAAFTAERRTKEIGVRKAMGASRPDIVRLLLWSFTKPVLWANLVAWPVAWWFLHRWLQGFAARIDLGPLMFVAAAAAAILIAWATVFAHAFRVAQAKPVLALRYE